MKIVITKNFTDTVAALSQEANPDENKLVNSIANISTAKFEELVENVAAVAAKHNKSFKTDKESLRCGVQVAPSRIKDSLLNVYGAGPLYSFEVSVVADKVKFTLFASIGGNTIPKVIQSEEMEQLLDNFLRENVENYDNLLQEEVEKVTKEASLER